MSWLTNHTLEKLIKLNADRQTKQAFLGVFPITKLPHRLKQYPTFLIINTQAHNLGGEHWYTVFISDKRIGEIFDSAARPVDRRLKRWLTSFTRTWTRNRRAFQAPFSTLCGAFALYYILNRLHHSSMKSVLFPYRNKAINDRFVLDFFHQLRK